MSIKEQAEKKCIFGTVGKLSEVAGLYKPSDLVFPVGIEKFNRVMDGGIREGELVTISGASGEGKTTFAQNLTYRLSKNGFASLWFSYEMNPWYLQQNFQKILGEKEDLWAYTPIELYERDLKFIETEIQEGLKEKATKIVFIDHLHYLIDLKSTMNSSLLIGGIVRELKSMAVRNNVVIFLIAHTRKINAGDELNLSSIRDSGMVVCESDYVFLVERKRKKQTMRDKLESGYLTSGEEFQNQSRITLAKNRRTGKILYEDFSVQNNKFIEITKDYE